MKVTQVDLEHKENYQLNVIRHRNRKTQIISMSSLNTNPNLSYPSFGFPVNPVHVAVSSRNRANMF
jgi:hypothetical protein